jgi:signal transduction histidine kinase
MNSSTHLPQSASISEAHAILQSKRLVQAIQELSQARTLDDIMSIVRIAARELTGADGATFILRDGNMCFYAEENAIAPLWKGRRFPMSRCVSGWTMLNRQAALIEDIYADERVPIDAYRPTFVRSLVMVPIRTQNPIGAIGNYWGKKKKATAGQINILQALADSTSIALENVQLYAEQENRVKERTAQLEAVNKELEAFARSISHDLRAPVRSVRGFCRILRDKSFEAIDDETATCLARIESAGEQMDKLIEDMLVLSRVSRKEIDVCKCPLSSMARVVMTDLKLIDPARNVRWTIADNISADGDVGLMDALLRNLLGNAWKFTSKRADAEIELGIDPAHPSTFYVRDNGAGFDMNYSHKLFEPFQRLHLKSDYDGTGVGLATVQRVVNRHNGRIWAEGAPGKGATFFITLPGLSQRSSAKAAKR